MKVKLPGVFGRVFDNHAAPDHESSCEELNKPPLRACAKPFCVWKMFDELLVLLMSSVSLLFQINSRVSASTSAAAAVISANELLSRQIPYTLPGGANARALVMSVAMPGSDV